MHRSRETVAGIVIILSLLACLFLLVSRSERPASHTSGQAGFIPTSVSGRKAPGSLSNDQRSGRRDRDGGNRLPPAPNLALRRSADERFPARLDLLVLDAATRLPVSNVRVTAVNRATEETVAEQVLPEGRGTIDLPNGGLVVWLEQKDYQERRLWIEFNTGAGQVSRQTVELRREVQVSGIVHDQYGAPVSGATILFLGSRRGKEQIVTSLDGRFNCRLPTGPVSGAAFKATNSVRFSSEVTAGSTAVLDITLPITKAMVSFRGRVLNQKAEPIEGAEVRVRPDSPGLDPGFSQTTVEDGAFAFSLPPSSGAIVSIGAPGTRSHTERLALLADLERDFMIESRPTFNVTLLDPEGKAFTKGFRVEGVGGSVSKIVRLPDGRYYSTDYPVDIHAIAVELGYGNSEVARLSAYEPEITLRIEPGGNLRGRAVDLLGRPISRFSFLHLQGRSLNLSHSLIDSPDGSFAVRHVAPGRYTLRMVANGHRDAQREISITAGRDLFIEMILEDR